MLRNAFPSRTSCLIFHLFVSGMMCGSAMLSKIHSDVCCMAGGSNRCCSCFLRYPFNEMKVLLIYPPQSPCAIAPSNFEPLTLEVLASTLPNHEVTVFDMRFETLSALEHLIQARDFDLACCL